ncbi:MAG: glycosyltransferase family 4 protein [Actinomycetota bacterium]|nr:glycosyltransferase family 4 protein [Actinomycetota bacterium]
MRILYLHQFFLTREGTGGTRSYEFARHLVAAGHEVVMVTAGSGESPRERVVDGIRVVEVSGGHGDYVQATAVAYPRRIASFLRFAASATATVLREAPPDVVFATSPPLTMALPALAASRRHRAPLVFEVRDLWPEAPIQMGALRSPVAQRLARELERSVYRASAHVVALSPGIRDGVIAAGARPERVTLIPNASDLDLFAPGLDAGDLRSRLGVGDRFVSSYFGTMGEANDLSQVIEAATILQERGEDSVAFVLQGDGKRRAALDEEVRRRGLRNVLLMAPSGKASVARLAAASDACMIIFKDVPILATNSPNKLFDTFAAGRPAIVNTPGWQRELVERHEAGVFARPGDPAHLAEQVLFLRDHPELAASYGQNARRLAEAEFDRRLLAERLRAVLEDAHR